MDLDAALDGFREAASRFLEAVDSAAGLPPAELLSRIGLCLPELYSNALGLPRVEPETSDVDDAPSPKRLHFATR
jgi:hypothetical protein